MMRPANDLLDITENALRQHPGVPLCVGFSGGSDSSALLDVLAQLPSARQRGLRAVHVDHGIHPDSRRWAEHCQAFCSERRIPLRVRQVAVHSDGSGLEAAARTARIEALTSQLQDGEALVLAHHRDDQVETILLKLLRGAGPHGLAGMRAWRPLATGWLWRPWLGVGHASIQSWIKQREIAAIDDPSNRDHAMTRSWLRHDILPRISAHLPQAPTSILHSGQLCADTRDYLEQQLDTHQGLVAADGSLAANDWLALPTALRGLLLERWLHQLGLTAPTTAQRRELERQAREAASDRLPQVHWPGTDVRLWRGRLYATASLPDIPPDWQATWDGTPMQLPLGKLMLVATGSTAASIPDHTQLPHPISVRLRRGGEYLHPAGDVCGRELRYVFQHHGVPPWLRPYCPLLYAGDVLLAVGGLCMTQAGADLFAPLGVAPDWRYH